MEWHFFKSIQRTKSNLIVIVILLNTFGVQGQEIFEAIRNNDPGRVKELFEKDSLIISSRNARQSTPLHVASAYDFDDIALYLIERGSDINLPNGNFYSPLMLAGIKITKILIEKGADINYKSPTGWTALAEALWTGKIEVADYLIDKGAIIPDIHTQEGKDRLFAALKMGSTKYLDRCLKMGLDPMFVSESKSNLIHFAAESNSIELVAKLIDLGVSVDKTNIYGWSPLHIAANNGNKAIVALLLEKGVDVNRRTIAGKTPYNLASESLSKSVLNCLDSVGADKSPQQFPVIKGDYLGQTKPGKTAVPFAPGILAAQYNYHSSIVFTPDGNELYGKSMMPMSFLYSKKVDGKWTNPDTLANMNYSDAPFISPDGKKFYYLAMQMVQGQPPKELIYAMDKMPTGWSEPYPLPEIINSIPGIHWQLSVDKNGNLYFGARQNGTVSSRIFCSEFKNGSYREPKIVESLKDIDAHSPFIAPDGSYLIISTLKELQILFRTKDGGWTKVKSLTDIIGCEGNCPIVTHDGKYMFFVHNNGDKFIPYWVSTKFIEEVRPKE